MPKINTKPGRIAVGPGRIGLPPSAAKQGIPATNVSNYLRLHTSHRQIFASNCQPPDLCGLANASEFDYYVIYKFPTRMASDPDNKTRLMGMIIYWDLDITEVDPSVIWYPDYYPGTLGTGYTLYSGARQAVTSSAYGDEINPQVNHLMLTSEDFVTPAGGNVGVGLLRTNHILPAAIAVHHCGQLHPHIDNWRPAPIDCTAGAMIRGYDSGATRLGLGELLYRVHNTDESVDTVAQALGMPLFCWGHHHGIWVGAYAGGAATRNLFGSGATVRLRLHSPLNESSLAVLPAAVYSSGAECTLTVTATANGTGSSAVTLAAAANPTLTDFATATGTLSLEVDNDVEVTVEVTIPTSESTDNWFCLHSLSLFPTW